MSAIITEKVIKQPSRPTFFLWMTVLMAFFIFGGFGLTYWQPMVSGALAPLPPIVHLHGLVYSSWIIVLVVQALLVNVNNVKLHRSLGTFGMRNHVRLVNHPSIRAISSRRSYAGLL